MSDIVERLREFKPIRFEGGEWVALNICTEAADEIQSLRQRVDRLEGALRFYADLDDWEDFRSDEAASAFDRDFGSKLGDDMGNIARAALSPKVQEGE